MLNSLAYALVRVLLAPCPGRAGGWPTLRGACLAIREKVQGPDYPSTATSLNNLAGLLRDQGELAAARQLWSAP